MAEKLPNIPRSAANEQNVPTGGLGSEISALFATIGLTSDIPELRGCVHLRITSGEDCDRVE